MDEKLRKAMILQEKALLNNIANKISTLSNLNQNEAYRLGIIDAFKSLGIRLESQEEEAIYDKLHTTIDYLEKN